MDDTGDSTSIRTASGHSRASSIYTIACMSAPPIAGSAVSFLVHGAGLLAVWRVLAGHLPLSRDRAMLALAVPLIVYCLATLLAFAANPVIASSWRYLPGLVTFLLYPLLYSAWSISPKAEIARATVIGAAIACYGAFALATIQSGLLGMWAEGGAGNAAVFGMVAAMAAAIALAGLFAMPPAWTAPLSGALVAGAAAILLSRARSSAVVFVLTAAMILFIHRRQLRHVVTTQVLVVTAVGLFVVAALGFGIIAERASALLGDWHDLGNGDLKSSLGFRVGLCASASTSLPTARCSATARNGRAT